MAFSNKSKELREEFNLTQAKLAKELNISRSCISMIEIGKNEPTATTLTAYADFFKISIDELLERDISTTHQSVTVSPSSSLNLHTGKILKELRQEKGLSQSEVAKAIKTSQRNIGRWENNENEPTASFISKLSKFFDVSADYILGLEDDFGVRTSEPMGDDLSSEERRLLNQYRSLPDKIKKTIREQIEVYSEPNELLSKSDKKV